MIRFLTWLRKEPLVFFSFVFLASVFFSLQLLFAVQREGQVNMIVLPLFFAAGIIGLSALLAIVLRIRNADALKALREESDDDRFEEEDAVEEDTKDS